MLDACDDVFTTFAIVVTGSTTTLLFVELSSVVGGMSLVIPSDGFACATSSFSWSIESLSVS